MKMLIMAGGHIIIIIKKSRRFIYTKTDVPDSWALATAENVQTIQHIS